MAHRVSYTDRSGKRRKARKWYAVFHDLSGRQQRMPGYTDRRLTERLEEKIRELVEVRQSHGSLEEVGLQEWADNLPERIAQRLLKFRLLDEDSGELKSSDPLSEHLDAFELHIREEREPPEDQTGITHQRIHLRVAGTLAER